VGSARSSGGPTTSAEDQAVERVHVDAQDLPIRVRYLPG
jgi:hypothetical protein